MRKLNKYTNESKESQIKKVILKLVNGNSYEKEDGQGIAKKDLQNYLSNVLKSDNLLSGADKEWSFNILKNTYLDIIKHPNDHKNISKADLEKIK